MAEVTRFPFVRHLRADASSHVLHYRGEKLLRDGKLSIKSLAQGSAHYPREIARIALLGNDGDPLTFTRKANALVVTLPEKRPSDFVATLKITPK